MGRTHPPHLLIFPYPAQGHIMPLMELAQTLATGHGLNVTFVNTQTNHRLITAAIPQDGAASGFSHSIRLVSIPDLDNEFKPMHELMQPMLEKLINELDHDHGKITCFLADHSAAWALEVGRKMGIKTAAFAAYSAATLLLISNIQNLIDDGIIDDQEGFPLKNEAIEFSPLFPSISIKDLTWVRFKTDTMKKIVFDMVKRSMEKANLAQWTIINTAQSLEPAALSLVPQARPVGPLLSGNRLGNSAGNLWQEDSECLNWLDQQPLNSVIYAAFGSTTIFSHPQFLNLANGLDLTNRPFLWVIRPGSVNEAELEYLEGVLDRVGNRGKVVRWAPQEKVLGHPSVACFFTHCGWNSTIEGVSNGLPLLCWPYFADQYMNQNYICNVWKVGLGFETKDEEEIIISAEEIKDRIETLVSDKSFKERALELKDSIASSVKENGSSYKNLLDFVEWVRN